MRPGIIEIDPQIKKGELVKVVDEKNKRPLAVGKVIRNLHKITDCIWNFEKQFK